MEAMCMDGWVLHPDRDSQGESGSSEAFIMCLSWVIKHFWNLEFGYEFGLEIESVLEKFEKTIYNDI